MTQIKNYLLALGAIMLLSACAGQGIALNIPLSTPATEAPAPVVIDEATQLPASPGAWEILVDSEAGSLALQGPAGEPVEIFPAGSTVQSAEWSPDGSTLLVVRANWARSAGGEVDVTGSPEIWRVAVEEEQIGEPALLFRLEESAAAGDEGPVQLSFGHWSPDSRHLLFWAGPLSASISADGMQPWILDVASGEASQPAEWALLNPHYQSWAPDGSALAITAGGYRSAQIGKWLNLFDVASGEVTTVISDTDQVPGIVAWSPQGDRIAYAAVPAAETSQEQADLMTWENPAIAGRRIYLLDPASGDHWRLNDADAFQDAPLWSEDGSTLYYVQKDGDQMVLMVADPETGEAEAVAGAQQPAPEMVGYYGQSAWDALLAFAPNRDQEH